MSEKEMRRIRGNEVSIIFQDPMTSLNPLYTVGKQVAEMILLYTKPGDEARRAAGCHAGAADAGGHQRSRKAAEILPA